MKGTKVQESVEDPQTSRLNTRVLVRRAIWISVLLLLLPMVVSAVGHEWFTAMGTLLVERYGTRGVFAGVFFIDWIPVPTSPEPIFFLGIAAGVDLWDLFVSSSMAAVLASIGMYGSGRLIDKVIPVRAWAEKRYPDLVQWVQEHGYKGLTIAALVPLPYAPMMWIAGMLRMDSNKVIAISLLRIVKTGFYLYLIALGWSLL